MDPKILRKYIELLQKECGGISKRDLAKKLGVGYSTILKWRTTGCNLKEENIRKIIKLSNRKIDFSDMKYIRNLPKSDSLLKINRNIELLKRRLGCRTNQHLADILGLTRVMIHYWLTGKRSISNNYIKKMIELSDGALSNNDFYTQ